MLETLRLDGKTAIVTGSGRGLGQAMAKALAQAGAELVCAARTREQIAQTVQEIHAAGGRAIAVQADVTDSAQVNRLLDQCLETYGKVDVMVANAGGGAIINVASGTALRGNRHFAYPTAKGGTISLTKSVATILGPHNIRANVIIPGFVQKGPPADEQEAEVRQRQGQMVPVRRLGAWWELGPLCVFLAAEASRYITGQSFIIDGGGLAGGLGPTGFVPRHELAD